MKYSVVWQQEALDEITLLWAAADSELRQSILKAWRQVDDVLAQGPRAGR